MQIGHALSACILYYNVIIGTSVFIHTGLADPVWGSRFKGSSVAIVPIDGSSAAPQQAELDEQRMLKR